MSKFECKVYDEKTKKFNYDPLKSDLNIAGLKILPYIGIVDINNNKIYLDDIVELSAYDDSNNLIGKDIYVINFDRCSYIFVKNLEEKTDGLTLDDLFINYHTLDLELKLIGNLKENPELLDMNKSKTKVKIEVELNVPFNYDDPKDLFNYETKGKLCNILDEYDGKVINVNDDSSKEE